MANILVEDELARVVKSQEPRDLIAECADSRDR